MKQEILRMIAMKMSSKKPFRERDLKKAIEKMAPVPQYSLQKKYAYFYDPYSQVCNTKKFMTFSDTGSEDFEPVNNEKLRESSGWRYIHNFITHNDERVYLFVVNQLRKKMGNRQPVQKKKAKKTATSLQVK
jgi:hypothetical protein